VTSARFSKWSRRSSAPARSRIATLERNASGFLEGESPAAWNLASSSTSVRKIGFSPTEKRNE
jgi:hypothetical protein